MLLHIAFGLVTFEMLCGFHPFYCENRKQLFSRILTLEIDYPDFLKDEAVDLFVNLLARNPEERLGSGPRGAQDIQQHPFFSQIDFEMLFRKEIEPPFKPDVSDDFDVTYFDDEFTNLPVELSPAGSVSSFLAEQPDAFKDFTYQDRSFLSSSS
jgi:serine/threonine protein kinase